MTAITYITETGAELTAPSADALEAGWDWYNDPQNTKADMITYCRRHGVELMLEDSTTLREDWAEVVAYTYATRGAA